MLPGVLEPSPRREKMFVGDRPATGKDSQGSTCAERVANSLRTNASAPLPVHATANLQFVVRPLPAARSVA